jgi:hypothetical protein
VTPTLADRSELAFWYEQEGVDRPLFSIDQTWSIGDRSGAPVGTVALDGDLLNRPDYWVRDAAGLPAVGLTHTDGLLASVSDPWHHIAWADGREVGFFRDSFVFWQGEAVAKWQVNVTNHGVGRRITVDGAWLWDPSDTVVATVKDVRSSVQGAYLSLSRDEQLDECLRWAALTLPLVTYERYRREQQANAHRRHHQHRHHH